MLELGRRFASIRSVAPCVIVLGLAPAASAQPDLFIVPGSLRAAPGGDGTTWQIEGRVDIALPDSTADPVDMSYDVHIWVNGEPISPGTGTGTSARLVMGLGTPISTPGGILWDCNIFCTLHCAPPGACTWGLQGSNICMCSVPGDGQPVTWVGRFSAPSPPLHPGDVVEAAIIARTEPGVLPEVITFNDSASIVVGAACSLADITQIGGTLEEPGSPDGQLSLDDILVFIDAYNDATGCPGTAPCNLADITESGGTLEEPGAPDGQLSLDDILVFIDAYNEGC